eukprot:870394_1
MALFLFGLFMVAALSTLPLKLLHCDTVCPPPVPLLLPMELVMARLFATHGVSSSFIRVCPISFGPLESTRGCANVSAFMGASLVGVSRFVILS